MQMFLLSLLFLLVTPSSYSNKPLKLATLSPHLTELTYSAGAGDQLVGVSNYSNYPIEAANLPIIGDAFSVNQELLLTLKPDVVFYWQGNIAQQLITQVENLGIQTIPITTQNIADIPQAIQQIATIAGTTPSKPTLSFLPRITQLQQHTNHSQNKSALIQISDRPIYTVNKNHWMSESLEICGLSNVFADLPLKSASVDIESIIAKNPDILIRFSKLKHDDKLNQFQQIKAIKNQHIIIVNPDFFSRPTLRLLNAIETLCNESSKLTP